VEVSDGAVEPVVIQAGINGSRRPESAFRSIDLEGQCVPNLLVNVIHQLADEADTPTVVLLQYSGYGYAPRGAPLWLLRALQRACGENGVPLITMFHELYATGPPWSSAFWLSPVQRYVAAQLARLSSAVVTNRAKSATWLRRYVLPETPVRVQPVFSNVGEPEHLLPWDEREPYAVVFGGRSMKVRLYDALQPDHLRMMRDLGISRIIDIGSSGVAPKTIHGTPVEERGIQPAESISALLSNARAGLLHYPVDYLTKSGILSGYVAHGAVPLIFSPSRLTEAIHEGQHFIRMQSRTRISTDEAIAVHQEGYAWYQTNACSVEAARSILDLMHLCNLAL
jgi:hypothetical protein